MYDGGSNRANITGSLVALGRLYSHWTRGAVPVILLQTAVSGTSMGQWLPGLLSRAEEAAVNVSRLSPAAIVTVFTWVQGESDAGRSEADYLKDLLYLIAALRKSTPGANSSTPFVIGSMVAAAANRQRSTALLHC